MVMKNFVQAKTQHRRGLIGGESMTEMERYQKWCEIAGSIEQWIASIEREISSKEFTETSDRHGLTKIDKKLYEALEIANKAASALADE